MNIIARLIASAACCVLASASAFAADTVRVGVIGSSADAPFFVAQDMGYFADEGIEPQFESMPSLARQVVPLSSGDLDVGNGAVSAGLYNAVSRDIPMKVVADKGHNAPGSSYNVFLVRKDLYDDGSIRSFADFKGRKVATIGIGSADMSIINEAMKTVGMSYDDIEQTALALPNHMVTLQNKGIDITLTPEPFATLIVEKGIAVKLAAVGDFYPNQQQSVVIYGGRFIKERPEVAQRFMNAYLRGVRTYMASVKDGTMTGEGADKVIASIVKNSSTKDVELLKRIYAVNINTDGSVNFEGMKKDWDFLNSKGLIENSVTPEDIVDMSFAEKATAKLDGGK